jgi:hypothetical protein
MCRHCAVSSPAVEQPDRSFTLARRQVHVPHRRRQMLMAREVLNRLRRCSSHRKMRAKRVAKDGLRAQLAVRDHPGENGGIRARPDGDFPVATRRSNRAAPPSPESSRERALRSASAGLVTSDAHFAHRDHLFRVIVTRRHRGRSEATLSQFRVLDWSACLFSWKGPLA